MKITAIIKTFLRDAYLFECVKSIKNNLDIHVIVGDDGYRSAEKDTFMEKYNVEYYTLPFNSGWSYGRNFLLNKVHTPYFLQCDDDFSFSKIDIDSHVNLLEHEKASIVTGRTIETESRVYEALFIKHKDYIQCKTVSRSQFISFYNLHYMRCHLGLQFFIGKTSIKSRWDEKIFDSNEHIDFFLTLKKNDEHVLYSNDLTVIHKPSWVSQHINNNYEEIRKNREKHTIDSDYFYKKWKIDHIVQPNGEIRKSSTSKIKTIDDIAKVGGLVRMKNNDDGTISIISEDTGEILQTFSSDSIKKMIK
jgi:GT2 family glycosyltransferase